MRLLWHDTSTLCYQSYCSFKHFQEKDGDDIVMFESVNSMACYADIGCSGRAVYGYVHKYLQ